jgi:hypothetical protein
LVQPFLRDARNWQSLDPRRLSKRRVFHLIGLLCVVELLRDVGDLCAQAEILLGWFHMFFRLQKCVRFFKLCTGWHNRRPHAVTTRSQKSNDTYRDVYNFMFSFCLWLVVIGEFVPCGHLSLGLSERYARKRKRKFLKIREWSVRIPTNASHLSISRDLFWETRNGSHRHDFVLIARLSFGRLYIIPHSSCSL